jgi:KUP system potassium uptake protein
MSGTMRVNAPGYCASNPPCRNIWSAAPEYETLAFTPPMQKTKACVSKAAQAGLCLGALGVVFGDIGTSPLYTMRECLTHLPPVDRESGVLGILSLMFWALTFIVSFKYLAYVTKADNRGEGGIFALLALSHDRNADRKGLGITALIILLGAALLYGDGVITPAISVLGAAEGFKSFIPGLEESTIVTIAVCILAGLFYIQSKGTKLLGSIFGPVMLVWFVTLGVFGLWHIVQNPEVLRAINPLYGYRLLAGHPIYMSGMLGAIVLTVTGAEALYADMGHFGRRYITIAWYGMACPGLLLNYFGQGAWAIENPVSTENPFFALAPAGPLQFALVILSILAAIIASQALISGTFSLTHQAIQLGYFPRLKILHTNAAHEGQIYIPLINQALAIGSIWIVISFKSSDALASAYGIAVTGTMAVTTFAFFHVVRGRWKWPLWQAGGLCALFLIVDLALLKANLHKFKDGGWLPVCMAVAVLAIMHAWKSGRNEIQEKVYGAAIAELELSHIAKSKNITRVSGSAVFMVATPKGTPLALLHHLKANKCLQKTTVLLTILTEEVPSIPEEERLTLEHMGEGVWRAVGSYGYMESPDVARLLERIRCQGVDLNLASTTFYFNREMIITGGTARMFEWQKKLYAFLSRNASPVKDYYRLMPSQIIEIGLPVQL